jgi:hypothetical protein
MCRVRLRILLAVHERDQRPALPEPVGLHLLGQEAVEPQEEDPVAAGHPDWRARGHRPHRRRRHPRPPHRPAHLVRPQSPRPLQVERQAQAPPARARHSRGHRDRGAAGRGARRRHRGVLIYGLGYEDFMFLYGMFFFLLDLFFDLFESKWLFEYKIR